MAEMGFETMLASSVCMTSPRPCGMTSALAASGNTSVCGKIVLVTTLKMAARNVVSI